VIKYKQMHNDSMGLEDVIKVGPTAILVIDLQNAYCSKNGSMAKLGHDVSINEEIVSRVSKFLDRARNLTALVIFTKMIEDSEYMADNAKLKAIVAKDKVAISSPGTYDFEYAGIKPNDTDKEITKKSYDAFSNPDLEKILSEKGIKNLIITGVNGDVCVDTTIRSAYTKGYNVIVPEDLVGTIREKVYRQESAIELWKQFFAYVLDSETIINTLQKYPK
jgi:ureidoacrylate peracid hydrolase